MKDRRRFLPWGAGLALVALTLVPLPTGLADTGSAGPVLPSQLAATSSVWDGQHAYIFGGLGPDGAVDTILRYDPQTGDVQTMGARLPTARYYTSAVWSGTYAYIFGGTIRHPNYAFDVLRYDPSTDFVTVVGSLPMGLAGSSAVWADARAYIFGGRGAGGANRSILRFDPSRGLASVTEATLPQALEGASAVWDGDKAYVFGGRGSEGPTAKILRYDPDEDQVKVQKATLPTPRAYTSAVWTGSHAYVFGGMTSSTYLDDVVSYDPSSDKGQLASAYMPRTEWLTSAVWDGREAHVVGGYNLGDRIWRFDPAGPSAPQQVKALSGPDAGAITLRWSPPEQDGGARIVNYRVYRGIGGDSMSLVAEVGRSLNFTDTRLGWGTSFLYSVSAVNANGQHSQPSKPKTGSTFAEPPSEFGLNRWRGEMGGGCLGGSLDQCTGMAQVGVVRGVKTGSSIRDPDGVVREWTARTGDHFSLPTAMDPEIPQSALGGYLMTLTPFPGGTVSFGMRIPTLPLQPVVIYEHDPVVGPITDRLLVTLTPTGHLVATHRGGTVGMTANPIATGQWHSVSMSYSPDVTTFKLWIDSRLEMTGQLAQGGPDGAVAIGIVEPSLTPFWFGVDDYVESTMLDAPIHGARVNYLVPHGQMGPAQWNKQSAPDADHKKCLDAAQNWQVVSEDVRLEPEPGKSCRPADFDILSTDAGAFDEYMTEGIPSKHVATAVGRRDLLLQPKESEPILAVRPVVAAKGPFNVGISLLDGGGLLTDDVLSWNQPTEGEEWFLPPNEAGHFWHSLGVRWTAKLLDRVALRLQNRATDAAVQRVDGLRLEYVWVPHNN